MSNRLNMSLDDSITKRKGEEGRGGRRDSGKPFRKRFDRPFRDRPFRNRPFRRFSSRGFGRDRDDRDRFRGDRFRGDRFREDRFDRGPRERRGRRDRRFGERSDKFESEKRSGRPISKLGLSRFIRRTRPGGNKLEEGRPSRSDRPFAEMRRLRISNLDFNITHKDLQELFSKVGSLTKNRIEFDDLGRSQGTALIEFEKHDSAVEAKKEYDGAVLDGRTISVEFDDDVKRRSSISGVLRKTISKDDDFKKRERRFDDDDRGGDFQRPFRRGGFRRRFGRFNKRD